VIRLDNDALIKVTMARYTKARDKKLQWEPLYRNAQDYLVPHRQTFDSVTPGQDKSNADKVFDSTALNAMADFVSNMASAIVPHRKNWMSLLPGNAIEEKDMDSAKEQLEKITKIFFQYLHSSNFHTEFSTACNDLAVGTGALLVTKGTKTKPLQFQAVAISDIYLEQGPFGRIDTAFRCLSEAYRNVQETWPDADLSADFYQLIEETPEAESAYIEACLAGEYDYPEETPQGDVRMVKKYGYRYVVIHEATKTLLVNRVQKSSPWVVFRWETLPGEMYGRGPALKALPDVKSLNVTKKLLLQGANRAIMGIWLAQDDGTINTNTLSALKPGTIIPVDYTSGERAGLVELPFNANVSLAQFVFQDMQTGIKRMMFSEPLGRVDLPVKSALEMQLRQQEWSRRIGSAYSRIEYECLNPLISRCLYILDEMGLIDLGGYLVDGEIINIDFTSPLAQSQDIEDLQAIEAYVSGVLQMFGPEIGLGLCKPEVVAKRRAQLLGVPKDITPNDEEIAQMKQALVQKSAMEAAAQQQQLMVNEGPSVEGEQEIVENE
jgi:hypothetical protein